MVLQEALVEAFVQADTPSRKQLEQLRWQQTVGAARLSVRDNTSRTDDSTDAAEEQVDIALAPGDVQQNEVCEVCLVALRATHAWHWSRVDISASVLQQLTCPICCTQIQMVLR